MELATTRDALTVKRIFQTMVWLVIPAMLGNFRRREFGDSSVDFQVFAKLAFWAACFAVCAYFYRLWIEKFARIDNFLLIPFFGLMLISCTYAPSSAYSIGAAFSVISLVLIFYASSSVLSYGEILRIILYMFSATSVVSILLYFAVPSVGRTLEWVGNSQVSTKRLAGLTGANGTGFISSLCIILAVTLRNRAEIGKRTFIGLLGLNTLTLLASNSKTATFALIVALSVIYFSRFHVHRLGLLFGGIAVFIALGFLIDVNWVLSHLSRSGNAEEVATGTGRVYIWKVVLELISQKPFTGWGFASSSFIIPQHAEEIGHTPPHAHNTFLQTTFAMGVFGLLLYVSIFIVKLIFTIRLQDRYKLGLLVFLLVHGLTEASIFQGVAGTTTLTFALAMALDYTTDRSDVRAASNPAWARD